MGEGFGAGKLTELGPDCGQVGGDVGIALGEMFSLDRDEREAGQIEVGLGEE